MKRIFFLMFVIAVVGLMLSSGCVGQETISPSPTSAPPTQIPATDLPPTETNPAPTETNTQEPPPTSMPTPLVPADLALISYANLGAVQELAALSFSGVVDLDFSPDGRYLRLRTGSQEIFYDFEVGEEAFRLEGTQRIYYNPDSSSIAALEGNSLKLYRLPGGDKLKEEFNAKNQLAALSPDGRLLIELETEDQEDSGTNLRMIDLTTGEERYRIFLNGNLQEESLHFDKDGDLFAGTYFVPPGTYVSTVWDVKTGWEVYTIYGFSEVALHPFGSELAGASTRESVISLISTVTWQQKHYLGTTGDEAGYYDLAYATAGRLIYALSDGETTRASFWYPPSGEKIDLDLGLDLLAVTISPDRRLLATSDKSGSVIIWGIPE